ncbi:hypothetical protein BX616_001906, partial [Lobosporangium transversale]
MSAAVFARRGVLVGTGITRHRTTIAACSYNVVSPPGAISLPVARPAFSFLTRTIHASPRPLRNKPPSWGDLIPQPQKPNSSGSNPLGGILLGPQYKRFGQNNRSGRLPIILDRRYQIAAGVVTVGVGGYYVAHLETVPMTGRRRFLDVTTKQEEMMAKEAYKQVMHQFGDKILPQSHPYTLYVKRVAGRIIKAAGME